MMKGEAIDAGQVASATNSVPQAASMFSPIMGGVGIVAGAIGNFMGNEAKNKQIEANITALRSELSWNTKVMTQNMVDVMASNKMSFWGSGLKTDTGTAAQVILNNQQVLGSELRHYQSNMNQQIKNLRSQRKSGFEMFF